MKKIISCFLLLITLCGVIMGNGANKVNAHATADGVQNRLQQVYADIQKKFSNGVFSVNGKDCYTNSSHTCSNCNLYSIVSNRLGENLTDFKKRSADGWQCAAFAKYVFVKTFGSCKETTDRYNIGSGQSASTYNSLKPGDLFYTSKHWMIYLSHNSSGVTVMDANGAGDLKIANKKTYSYSHGNLTGQVTVWHSNHWDEINTQYATKHTWGAWTTTTAATCTTTGTKTRTCSCGQKETQTMSVLGHNYSSSYTVDSAATCTSSGSKSKHCTRCSAKTSVTTIAALGHSYSSTYTVDKAATCTSTGLKSKHCTICSARTSSTAISALGHSWSGWNVTRQATTAAEGQETRSCSSCRATETRTTAKLPTESHIHQFCDWMTVNSANCTKKGIMHRVCSTCHTEETMEVATTGHSYGEWITVSEPTLTSNGQAQRSCEICNEVEVRTLTINDNEIIEDVETYEDSHERLPNEIEDQKEQGNQEEHKTAADNSFITIMLVVVAGLVAVGVGLGVWESIKKKRNT